MGAIPPHLDALFAWYGRHVCQPQHHTHGRAGEGHCMLDAVEKTMQDPTLGGLLVPERVPAAPGFRWGGVRVG